MIEQLCDPFKITFCDTYFSIFTFVKIMFIVKISQSFQEGQHLAIIHLITIVIVAPFLPTLP
jgi:hypothetical protein